MRTRGLMRPFFLLGVLAALTLVLLAACGDDEEKTAATKSPAATVAPTAAKIDISNVPELADGKLLVGSDITYPPVDFFEEGTQNATGVDVDLAKAMGEVLGVDVEFQSVALFAGIIGDLEAKRYDIVMSAISITEERQQKIDLIPYFGPVGTGILTPTGNPNNFKVLEDLCGMKVSAQAGTYQVDQVTALNDGACKDNQISLTTFPDNPASVQELKLGRVDAQLADDPVVAYNALQSDGDLEVAATGFEAAQYGMGVRKDSTALKTALEAALDQIIDNGEYDNVLEKWGQEQFAVR